MLERDQARIRLQQEQERTEEKSRFIAMITHELKTPLAVISLAFDLGETTPQALPHARRAVSDMESIIDHYRQADMLEYADWQPQATLCALDAVLAKVCASSRAPDRLELSTSPLQPLQSDRQLLEIILTNLTDNALKYGDPTSPVRVRAGVEPLAGRTWARVDVENAVGAFGLPDPTRLYCKYYRGPGAHGCSGSGLGLYLVRGFTERLGGRIQYEPTDTRVCFTVWLPI